MDKNLIKMIWIIIWKIIKKIGYFLINLYFPIDEVFLELLSHDIRERQRLRELEESGGEEKKEESENVKIIKGVIKIIVIGAVICFILFYPTEPPTPSESFTPPSNTPSSPILSQHW